jgi:hypothetical protein
VKLVHFSAEPLGDLYPVAQKPEPSMKPSGFWVSDEDDETSWSSWCYSEQFGLERMAQSYDVALTPNHNVLILTDVAAIDAFSETYGFTLFGRSGYIAWAAVAYDYAGILITPYQWSHRMTNHTFWYYGWDCASGCIWNPTAIASVTPILAEAKP